MTFKLVLSPRPQRGRQKGSWELQMLPIMAQQMIPTAALSDLLASANLSSIYLSLLPRPCEGSAHALLMEQAGMCHNRRSW